MKVMYLFFLLIGNLIYSLGFYRVILPIIDPHFKVFVGIIGVLVEICFSIVLAIKIFYRIEFKYKGFVYPEKK